MEDVDNKFFPELQFYIYYYKLNNKKITIDKNNKIYKKCETLIKGEYNKSADAKKFIDKISKNSNFSLINLTNMLYASIGIGILKLACSKKCSSKISQSGGAWDENGEWVGDGQPGLQDYAVATYNNVMSTIPIPEGLGFRVANEYLESIPGLPVNEDDDIVTRRTKKVVNFGAYISFTWSLINLCVYGTYLINIMYTDLLGIKDAGPEIYEFNAPPDPPYLSEGNNDEKSMAVIEYKSNDMWSDQLYPKKEMIDKIRVIDVILNRGPAREDLQLYLSVLGDEVKSNIVEDLKKNVFDKGKEVMDDKDKQLAKINERRENTYNMDSYFDIMRFNLDQMRRYMGVWGPVNDQVTALSRSMDKQQLKTEFQLRQLSNEVKYKVEDTVRIHGENIFNAANQVFWSGGVFISFAVALIVWCAFKKKKTPQPQIRIEIRAPNPQRQRSDTIARASGTLTLTHYFHPTRHRWVQYESTRSGQVNREEDFAVNDERSSRCPVGCVTFGGKRRKRKKTRRKKRRKTRRKSKKRKSKRRRRKRKKTRRKRR